MIDESAARIAEAMREARADTLRLFDVVAREADLRESPGFGFRPVLWHLAHIGVFEAYWILQKAKGERSPDERYERIFDPIATPREDSKNLPSRREMETYLVRVRDDALRYLEAARFDETQPTLLRRAYVFRLVLEHERQHQETLAYLLQLLDPAKKTRPTSSTLFDANSSSQVFASSSPATTQDMITIPAGECLLGATRAAFMYDNELPAHTIFVSTFKIDRQLTTNEEYSQFIAEGGYERREWWSEEGWARREQEKWSRPLYWTRDGNDWRVRTMFADGEMQPQHPVTGVSWYEAEAYARFRGKRLPTEAEWEKAAAWDAARKSQRLHAWGDTEPTDALCNFDFSRWGTTPIGSFPRGAGACDALDMTGNLWEWTGDEFKGYPGFKAFPYPEYSEIWFDGDHRVLKGGSWATRASVLRACFRNFFRRHFRIAFAGIRCAMDADV